MYSLQLKYINTYSVTIMLLNKLLLICIALNIFVVFLSYKNSMYVSQKKKIMMVCLIIYWIILMCKREMADVVQKVRSYPFLRPPSWNLNFQWSHKYQNSAGWKLGPGFCSQNRHALFAASEDLLLSLSFCSKPVKQRERNISLFVCVFVCLLLLLEKWLPILLF